MKSLKIISLLFGILGLILVFICIFTDYNDALFLPLCLIFSLLSNGINYIANKYFKEKKDD